MSSQIVGSGKQLDLRLRAVSRLTGNSGKGGARASASEALGALFELASTPATAGDALALLHELQVLQVELDLQDEEIRTARAQLEVDLARQIQLYDFAPVSCFTIDTRTTLLEMNATGARLLGAEREDLLGRKLGSFLGAHGADTLQTLLARVSAGHEGETCTLELMVADGKPRSVHASATTDPAGQGFLVAFINAAEPADGP